MRIERKSLSSIDSYIAQSFDQVLFYPTDIFSTQHRRVKDIQMRVFIILLSVLTFNTAFADELHLIVNGKAIHLDSGNYNERNWGLGFEYDFTPRKNWITFINASYFKDSTYQTSKYVGGGVKKRFMLGSKQGAWHVDVGVLGFLMTRKDYKNNSPFPGVLPFVSMGNDNFALSLTYIPQVTPKNKDLFYIQALFKVAEF